MKTLNTISNKIQTIIIGFKKRILKNDVIDTIDIEENEISNEIDSILFQINKQEDEFLFI